MENEAEDINGNPVFVGSRVRVLRIKDSVLAQLSEADAEATRAMFGSVLEVNEIDEFGGAWVEDTWTAADGASVTHSLGLGPQQMELVQDGDEDAGEDSGEPDEDSGRD
ncbi:MAG: hypothetical protein OEW79_03175 [Betaproteobacteria bacterium]|jgi:hypothetical protein|nr:hypothetical protein [Betaproteobacteria bacterium]MDH4293025.1 hypothetical protein [Betaproteobacteria bacterium]MDH5341817.1 hypothetical protein [Betaproteobacteria bacterium]